MIRIVELAVLESLYKRLAYLDGLEMYLLLNTQKLIRERFMPCLMPREDKQSQLLERKVCGK